MVLRTVFGAKRLRNLSHIVWHSGGRDRSDGCHPQVFESLNQLMQIYLYMPEHIQRGRPADG